MKKFKELLLGVGLESDKVEEITGKMTEQKIYLSSHEKVDERYDKMKDQRESLSQQLTAANETIEELKKSNLSNEELQGKVKEYESEIERLSQEQAESKKEMALDLQLMKAGAKNTKAVKALLDYEKIELTDEGISGVDEQLSSLKETESYLFEAEDNQPRIQSPEEPNGENEETSAFEDVLNSRYN